MLVRHPSFRFMDEKVAATARDWNRRGNRASWYGLYLGIHVMPPVEGCRGSAEQQRRKIVTKKEIREREPNRERVSYIGNIILLWRSMRGFNAKSELLMYGFVSEMRLAMCLCV